MGRVYCNNNGCAVAKLWRDQDLPKLEPTREAYQAEVFLEIFVTRREFQSSMCAGEWAQKKTMLLLNVYWPYFQQLNLSMYGLQLAKLKFRQPNAVTIISYFELYDETTHFRRHHLCCMQTSNFQVETFTTSFIRKIYQTFFENFPPILTMLFNAH